jgi:hypothetical protein
LGEIWLQKAAQVGTRVWRILRLGLGTVWGRF